MLLRLDHPRGVEGGERGRRVLDAFDLEPQHGEAARDLVDRGVRFEMIFQPAQRELHGSSPRSRLGTSSGRKP